jgi:hypothetical protein
LDPAAFGDFLALKFVIELRHRKFTPPPARFAGGE